jgi:hypothetical protein
MYSGYTYTLLRTSSHYSSLASRSLRLSTPRFTKVDPSEIGPCIGRDGIGFGQLFLKSQQVGNQP